MTSYVLLPTVVTRKINFHWQKTYTVPTSDCPYTRGQHLPRATRPKYLARRRLTERKITRSRRHREQTSSIASNRDPTFLVFWTSRHAQSMAARLHEI